MSAGDEAPEVDRLLPYVPALLRGWNRTGDDDRHMSVVGSLAFVDISGFTRLTARLAKKGKVGAEEMSDLLSATFAGLLTEAHEDGADLVKWGGDAMLLLFQGVGHVERAARAAHRMRARLRNIGRLPTSSGVVALRMSVGLHSGEFDFFLVGDPDLHRELVISGPAASVTADTEASAAAGQIGLSPATAALLDPHLLGPPTPLGGRLLRFPPSRTNPPEPSEFRGGPDPAVVLPPPIREHLLKGWTEPEHRLITVAFVQFSGTDNLLLSAGPSGLADALDEVVRNVQHACADLEVTFFESDINRDGGKIMLTAGAPRSSDHDEERMLRVARLVLDRAGQLPLRVGINRGHVFSGDFGPTFRSTYSVKGDAINLAARVMGKAAPGQTLATLEVVEHSQTTFRITELPPFLVKGKSQPVRAADIGALVGTRTEDRKVFPLVGRAEELATLVGALDDAQAGRGRLVEIMGGAGIGKSRLVTELLTGRDDLTVMTTHCEVYQSSTPYFPFRRLLREALDVPAEAGPAEVAERLAARVSTSAPHLRPWLPLLGVAMDVPLAPTQETRELADQFRKRRLEEVVTELLASVLTTASVLVIEDVHVMDDASADLLRRLTEQLTGRPILVLVTRREPLGGSLPAPDTGGTTIRLGPLSTPAALELVEAELADHPLPPQAASRLVDRAGGNPMFLEALVTAAGRSTSVAELPESVEGLVTSQLDRLAPADRTVVRYAAVFGTLVDEPALDLLLAEHDAEVPAGAMARLADFLVREGQGQLRFRTALSREVAYEKLPFSRRKTLHDHVGLALERAGQEPESRSELLSLHFFHAGRHEKAWRYSVLAGERALAKFAHGEAIDFFERAAQSTPYHPVVGPQEVARVLERLADSRFLVGSSDQAQAAYALARRQLRGDAVRLAGIIEKEARIDHRRRKYSQAMRRITRGLRALEGCSGREAAVARSLLTRRYAYSRFSQGRIDEALHWAGMAALEAEDAVDRDALAQAYEMLNAIYAGSGRDEDLPYGRLALQAYRELGNLPRQGHCLNNLAVQAFTRGRWGEALTSYRQASDIFRRIGDTASEVNALYNEAELLVCQRRYDEADRLLPTVLRIARALEDDELVALALREQARTLAGAGNAAAAASALADVRARFEALGEPEEVRRTEVVLAEVLLDADRVAEAGEVLDRVVGGTDEQSGVAPTLHRLIARQHLAVGRYDEGRLMLDTGLEVARREDNHVEEGLLLLEVGALASRDGRPDEGATAEALRILDAMGVLPMDGVPSARFSRR